MRNLSYWQMRGYPKVPIDKSSDFRGRLIDLNSSMLAGLTQAQRLEVIRKAIEAGMGGKPMEAKRS